MRVREEVMIRQFSPSRSLWMMLSMFISPSAMVVLVGAGEVQSNVTDITSGHSAAADRLAGERLRDVRLGQQALLSTLSCSHTSYSLLRQLSPEGWQVQWEGHQPDN